MSWGQEVAVTLPGESAPGPVLSTVHAFDIEGAKRRLAERGGYEVVHSTPGLEIGVYVLVAPAPDRQSPHADDEVYIVLEGRGMLEVEGKQVEMYNVHSVLFHEEQATYFDDGVKSHLAVVDALGDKRVCLMKNHGAIIASDSLENATIEAITLEKAARIQLECEAIGGTPILDAEVRSGKAMYRTHYLPQMWAADLERLRRSDPDLFLKVAPVPSTA